MRPHGPRIVVIVRGDEEAVGVGDFEILCIAGLVLKRDGDDVRIAAVSSAVDRQLQRADVDPAAGRVRAGSCDAAVGDEPQFRNRASATQNGWFSVVARV